MKKHIFLMMGRMLTPLLCLGLLAGCDTVHLLEQQRLRRFQKAGMVAATADLKNASVHYWSGGQGHPLLLVHGFGANALWQWHRQVVPMVERGVRVIAPDLLWFGDTVPSGPLFTIEDQAEMLIQLMDHLQIKEFDLLGLSYGGIIAFHLAHEYPERVRKVILSDSPGPVSKREDVEALVKRFDVRSINDLLIPEEPAGVRRVVRASFYRKHVPGFLLDDLFELLYSSNRTEKIALMDSLAQHAQDPHWRSGKLQQPTLLVWGEHDGLFPREITDRLAQRIAGPIKREVIPLAGHSPNLERPKRFNRSVLDFLDADPGFPGG